MWNLDQTEGARAGGLAPLPGDGIPVRMWNLDQTESARAGGLAPPRMATAAQPNCGTLTKPKKGGPGLQRATRLQSCCNQIGCNDWIRNVAIALNKHPTRPEPGKNEAELWDVHAPPSPG
jgi:hypothetical protein